MHLRAFAFWSTMFSLIIYCCSCLKEIKTRGSNTSEDFDCVEKCIKSMSNLKENFRFHLFTFPCVQLSYLQNRGNMNNYILVGSKVFVALSRKVMTESGS